MSFNQDFQDIMASKGLGTKSVFEIDYRTGIDLIDYHNGSINKDGSKTLGVRSGRYMAIVGPSGSSKTTIALQIANNIVRPIENASFILIDKEKSTDKQRIMNVTDMTTLDFKEKVTHIQKNFYTETLYKLIRNLVRIKKAQFEKLKVTYHDEVKDKDRLVLPPTVLILDSLAMLFPLDMSGDIDDKDNKDEIDGNAVGMQVAKANAGVVRKILDLLDEANLFMIFINHISTKIKMNSYEKSTKQLNFLGENEHIAGGGKVIYLAHYLFKVTAGAKLKLDKDYKVKGNIVWVEFLKSRSAPAGTSFPLIFLPSTGIHNVLSNFHFLVVQKVLKGGGQGSYLPGYPDYKFTKSGFLKLYKKDKEFRKIFKTFMKNYLEENVLNVVDDATSSGKKKKKKDKKEESDSSTEKTKKSKKDKKRKILDE